MKKQRASLSGIDEESLRSKFGLGLLGAQGDVLGRIEQDKGKGGTTMGPVAQDKPLFGSSLDSIAREKVIFGEPSGRQEVDKAAKIEEMEEEL